jgi:hypothetical protein
MSIPPKLLRVLRSAGAVVLGYAVIVVCTSVGFKPLGVIVHLNAPPRIQAAAAFVAVGSGLLGAIPSAMPLPFCCFSALIRALS